ncbi:uncharacterized protein [Primulina huaijiensis]|uniref:uncharacterized protein isoform X2 n=1 Tax=Primulina huaijiensis TaxID=1492673 RepID=UPI003CC74F23
MAGFIEQMEEIMALLLSGNKALAYPKLLHLQQISAFDSSSIQKFADSSHAILFSLLPDIFHNDEEIAARALKCLGFMIYDPTILAAIGGDDANVVIQSLVKVIATTKIKSVCNLGVWCISIQQFNSSMLDQHLHSLLRAIVHAIDNPSGSLSTTFEAMQAVVKLTSSLAKEMRSISSVWMPPIYRRLVSVDKRDRDISERCLLKIKPIICPPPVILSKALVLDLNKKLLSAMKELVHQGMKIQSLQAWGWFIRLLGPYAMKNKHLVNEMLKILEQTLSDFDSQVQIASLVAWEGLIDALIEPPVNSPSIFASEHGDVVLSTSEGNSDWTKSDKYLKRIKLIMTPLIGIMSSKLDVSVHASCLSTWSYLLHKLEGSVSCQSVIKNVWEPIIELVFLTCADSKNILLYFCLDLLHAMILGKNQQNFADPYNQEIHTLLLKNTSVSSLSSGKYPLRPYPVICSPRNLCQLDMLLKMISILLNQESNSTGNPEGRRQANEAVLRLFESLLEAVQRSIAGASITYDDIMQCLNTIFRFLAKVCENVNSVDHCSYYYSCICLKYLEVVTERLESSILESPLYKLGIEFTCIKKSEPASEIKRAIVPSMCSFDFEEKVTPLVYLSILYFSVIINSSSKEFEHESLLQKMQDFMKFLSSSYHSHEVVKAFVCSLYRVTLVDGLQIWVVLANCLKDFIDGENCRSILNTEANNIGYSLVLLLLAYPFSAWSSSHINFKLQIVVEPWKLLYASVERASLTVHFPITNFLEDLCAILNGFIEQTILTVGSGNDLHQENIDEFVLLCGSIIILILKQLTSSIRSKESKSTDYDGRKYVRKNGMLLAARCMKLFRTNKQGTEPSDFSLVSRFFTELVNLVGCLQRQEDVVMLIESTSSPLLEWLSDMHLLDKNTNDQLQMLWNGILGRLLQCPSSLKFDSSMLKLQQPLLERTLDHPNPTICEPTISFWNSTYGEQIKLDFPQNLLPVLDKLYRSGKIKLCNITCHMEAGMNRLQRSKVITTLNKCSKRVENIGNPTYGSEQDFDKLNFITKRKQPEMTEHQREVRRAQQGRARDCNGHGPGIRTYTGVDFSQVNEESQDSEDIRDSESILEMLKKVC